MGTNYYLLRKATFDPNHRLPASLGCSDGLENHPVELTNGWLWDETYYPSIETLNERYFQRIHIGKSSCGWRFALCIYPTENPRFLHNEYHHEPYLEKSISSLDDWIALFRTPGNVIADECKRTISVEKMLSTICERKGFIEAAADGWSKKEERHSERYRVINGLYAHDETRMRFGTPQFVQVMPPDCTYDLILSGNDPESGEVYS